MGKINWYALYVRMHHEKRTAERLAQMEVEYYQPVQEVVRQWSDRKKKLQMVVIPMMIFVHTDEVNRIKLMQQLPSVTGTLIDRCTHRPAIIREDEMERFKFMLDFSEEAVTFTDGPIHPGEKVQVLKGPLKGLTGELIEMHGKTRVSVRIENLGYAAVEIPAGFIERLNEK